jgi:hypothetical protein
LSGWQLTGGVSFTFPEGTILPSGGFLVVSSTAANPTTALGPWSGTLSNQEDSIRLRNRSGGIMDELTYKDSGDWPAGADGSGSSLAKFRADSASADAASWRVSAQSGGTPGTDNFPVPPPAPSIIFNELAPAGPGFFVELRNTGTAPLDLGGHILASPDGGGSYTLPSTQLPPGALISLDAARHRPSLPLLPGPVIPPRCPPPQLLRQGALRRHHPMARPLSTHPRHA